MQHVFLIGAKSLGAYGGYGKEPRYDNYSVVVICFNLATESRYLHGY